ncbi:MAG: VWA domain-containing protein [Candidatus Methylacidiphilales bacterium]|nr:hypothetical protein [Candidatus Methylacidiphilales bacterium]
MHSITVLNALRDKWAQDWPRALEVWSRFTQMREPRWCFSEEEEKGESLTGSFAMIRLVDHAVVISIRLVLERRLQDFAVEILAHEIGHHVFCPGDLSDQGRVLGRMRRGLPSRENDAPMIANLYYDLLINDRLQRTSGLNMEGVYVALDKFHRPGAEQKRENAAKAAAASKRKKGTPPPLPPHLGGSPADAPSARNVPDPDKLWTFYMRIYEVLWGRPRGTLAHGLIGPEMEADAVLGARLIRVYASDWVAGSGKFAALCLPYLLDSAKDGSEKAVRGWLDTENAGAGGDPSGLIEMDGDEGDCAHPAFDPRLTGYDSESEDAKKHEKELRDIGAGTTASQKTSAGQRREPYEFGQILNQMGMKLSGHEVAVRYYREMAKKYLIPFPVRQSPQAGEPMQEGLESWEFGDAMEELNWFETILRSPYVVPGFTTLQRTYTVVEEGDPGIRPVDLDLYVDCSGSMPNPQHSFSPATLAGAIVAMSALRVGSRVQATLWSGRNQFKKTKGFISDETEILEILTAYLGGGTAFPLHVMRDTYEPRKPTDRPVHMLVISDEGVDTLYMKDPKGLDGEQISAMALQKAGAGSMVLVLWQAIEKYPLLVKAREQGWNMYAVKNWDDVITFSKAFSKKQFGQNDVKVQRKV